ncbi:MAG TPA: hypothetical protein VF677_07385, partial [Flavobacterium sp.]
KDLSKRLLKWNDFEIKLREIKDLHLLCNPFYIGYGNPNSEILFLGKEKAFSIMNNPDLFLHESINNNKQWEYLIKGCNIDKLEFNPLFPQKYFEDRNSNYKIKKRHTWGMYSELVKAIINPEIKSGFREGGLENNFFRYCFATEVNHIPSKYSVHLQSIDDRKELLQHAFYKTFKYVIVGAIGSINITQIKTIFGITTESKQIQISKEGDKRKRFIEVIKNDSQKIILCNQLSGAAGWTSSEILSLIDKIKK